MSNKQLLLYSFGSTGLNILNFYFANKIAFVYDAKIGNPVIPLLLLTILLGASRLLDALSDPFIGWYNDRLKYSGKSNVLLFAGGIPFACFAFWWLWHPPLELLGTGCMLYLWFLFVVNVYFITYTLIAIPYDAYLVEMAIGEKDRIKASSAKSFFGILGLAGGVYWISHQNVSLASTGLVIMAFFSLLLAMGGMKFSLSSKTKSNLQNFFSTNIPINVSLNKKNNSKQNLKNSFYSALQNKSLVLLLCFILMTEIMGALFIKYLEYFIHHLLMPLVTQKKQIVISILYGSFILAMIGGMLMWSYLAKKHTSIFWLKVAMTGLIFILPHYTWLGEAPVIPSLLQGVGFFSLVGLFYAALPILTVVELAKVCDDEENKKEEKIHSLYFGLYAFLRKMALVGGLFLLMVIIESFDWAGNTLWGYRSMGPTMALLLITALWFLNKFDKYQSSQR